MATVADIEPASLALTPGEPEVFTLTVRNDGEEVEAYHLSAVNDAADHVVIDPDTLLVHPGETGTATATITLERTGRWSVGGRDRPFPHRSGRAADEFLVVEAIATIQSFSDVAAVLSPPALEGRVGAPRRRSRSPTPSTSTPMSRSRPASSSCRSTMRRRRSPPAARRASTSRSCTGAAVAGRSGAAPVRRDREAGGPARNLARRDFHAAPAPARLDVQGGDRRRRSRSTGAAALARRGLLGQPRPRARRRDRRPRRRRSRRHRRRRSTSPSRSPHPTALRKGRRPKTVATMEVNVVGAPRRRTGRGQGHMAPGTRARGQVPVVGGSRD